MFPRNFTKFLAVAVFAVLVAAAAAGCQRAASDRQTVAPASLRDVAALKLNFRFEADVPPPPANNQRAAAEEKNGAIQNDFDTARPQEVLERTLTSPDKQRVLAVYRKVEDLTADYRLDMYSPDGKLLRKVTPGGMAVRFPDTIVWSPDSNNIAFVATTRTTQAVAASPPPNPDGGAAPQTTPDANANTQTNPDADANPDAPPPPPAAQTPGMEQPKAVLTFRTEQIYTVSREGVELKPLTQNEGLIYFYFVWAPDSSALASLAATWREWQVGSLQADQRGEMFIPAGRPRLVERNGRERRLDDTITVVQPVWSPDSAKVALAFDKEIRVYDAIGDAPTQAAIPLRVQLQISSKAYDDKAKRELEGGGTPDANANTGAADANANAGSAQQPANAADVNTLPDENSLVSFNPIIELEWTEPAMLYLRTGYVKEMKNPGDSTRSFLRWHRLMLSPQPVALQQ